MIYTQLKGRLGNQMFIYAFSYALSRENNNEPICFCGQTDEIRLFHYGLKNMEGKNLHNFCPSLIQRLMLSVYCRTEEKMQRTNVLYRSDFYRLEMIRLKLYSRWGLFLCQNGYLPFERKLTKKENIYLNGYFQSERYFQKYKEEIKQIFRPTSPVMVQNRHIFEEISNNPDAVCVDFRLADYINNPLHGVCTMDYYKNAMKFMAEKLNNPVFYVFSTDLDLITEATKKWGYHIIIEDGKSPDYEKLRLMSACKHFIITNSTYDWWAQYLSECNDKIVVAPSKWFGLPCPCDIYMDDWVLLEV